MRMIKIVQVYIRSIPCCVSRGSYSHGCRFHYTSDCARNARLQCYRIARPLASMLILTSFSFSKSMYFGLGEMTALVTVDNLRLMAR